MDPVTIGYLCIILLLSMLALGVPVGMALAASGLIGMFWGVGEMFAFGQLRTLPYSVVSNYAYAVLPLFVFMGVVAEATGITGQVFRAADVFLRSIRGGLYMVVTVGSAVFAAVSGSTTVNSVVFTRLAFPQMLKFDYSRSLSIGCIAAAGSFAAMIPPSITMVIYAIMTEQSIGRLLLAGLVPGAMSVVAYIIAIMVMVRVRPSLAPAINEVRASWREKLGSLRWLGGIVALLGIVLGGIYFGIFPPSAAGAVGATGAMAIGLAVMRGRVRSWLGKALFDAAAISCVLFVILIGGLLFSRMLVVLGVINEVVEVITLIADTPLAFLLFVAVIYIVLGCFLDTTSMMVVTLPFLYPISQELGVDPIWFGIIIVKLIEISVITPPVGLNLFAVMSAVDRDTHFQHVVKGVLPFFLIEIVLLGFLIAFPVIATGLPSLMMR